MRKVGQRSSHTWCLIHNLGVHIIRGWTGSKDNFTTMILQPECALWKLRDAEGLLAARSGHKQQACPSARSSGRLGGAEAE